MRKIEDFESWSYNEFQTYYKRQQDPYYSLNPLAYLSFYEKNTYSKMTIFQKLQYKIRKMFKC